MSLAENLSPRYPIDIVNIVGLTALTRWITSMTMVCFTGFAPLAQARQGEAAATLGDASPELERLRELAATMALQPELGVIRVFDQHHPIFLIPERDWERASKEAGHRYEKMPFQMAWGRMELLMPKPAAGQMPSLDPLKALREGFFMSHIDVDGGVRLRYVTTAGSILAIAKSAETPRPYHGDLLSKAGAGLMVQLDQQIDWGVERSTALIGAWTKAGLETKCAEVEAALRALGYRGHARQEQEPQRDSVGSPVACVIELASPDRGAIRALLRAEGGGVALELTSSSSVRAQGEAR